MGTDRTSNDRRSHVQVVRLPRRLCCPWGDQGQGHIVRVTCLTARLPRDFKGRVLNHGQSLLHVRDVTGYSGPGR